MEAKELQELKKFIPTFRKGALTLKQFYALNPGEKEIHIAHLTIIPREQLSDVDKHILRMYSPEIKQDNFFSIEHY